MDTPVQLRSRLVCASVLCFATACSASKPASVRRCAGLRWAALLAAGPKRRRRLNASHIGHKETGSGPKSGRVVERSAPQGQMDYCRWKREHPFSGRLIAAKAYETSAIARQSTSIIHESKEPSPEYCAKIQFVSRRSKTE
jgi:hypothetical protein